MVESAALCDVDGLQEGVVPEGAALNGEAVGSDVASVHREFPEVREGLQGVGFELGELVKTCMKGSETMRNHISTYHCDKDKQNAHQILREGHFKSIFCLFYAPYFEIIS